MFRHQRVDDLAQRFALDHLRQIVESEIDTVVGYPALREIVSSDAFRAVATADLTTTLGGSRAVELGTLSVVKFGAQHCHGLGAVLVLRAFLLHRYNNAARDVSDADC